MILLCLPLLFMQAAPAPPADARAVVERLEERQRGVRDVVARFTQTYKSGALGREIVERGEVRLKRPGRMRWEYQAPDKKLFVADGQTFFFYVPADRQVIVRAQDEQLSIAAILLTGKSGLLDEFSAATAEAAPAGHTRIRLSPRRPNAEIDSVLVDLDAKLRIASIHIFDAQGNGSRFDFSSVRENTGLEDKLFRFVTPAGVEVIEG
jgi:outer membrane lipoprotein carrier protein